MSDYTDLPKAVQDLLAKKDCPLTEEQYLLMSGALAIYQSGAEITVRTYVMMLRRLVSATKDYRHNKTIRGIRESALTRLKNDGHLSPLRNI